MYRWRSTPVALILLSFQRGCPESIGAVLLIERGIEEQQRQKRARKKSITGDGRLVWLKNLRRVSTQRVTTVGRLRQWERLRSSRNAVHAGVIRATSKDDYATTSAMRGTRTDPLRITNALSDGVKHRLVERRNCRATEIQRARN